MPGDAQVRSRLLLHAAPWDTTDDAFASRIPFDSPADNADLLAHLVQARHATSHRIVRDGERVGVVVSRVDVGTAARELVVIAAYLERHVAGSLCPPLDESIEALARAEQCVSIRFHTCRAALARIACAAFGYRVSEIVLRRNLT